MTSKTLSDLYALVHIIFRTTLWKRYNYYHHSHFTEGNWSRNCHVINERQNQDSNSSLIDPKFLCLIIKVYSTSCPHSYRKPRCLVKGRTCVHRDLGSRIKSVSLWINCFPESKFVLVLFHTPFHPYHYQHLSSLRVFLSFL